MSPTARGTQPQRAWTMLPQTPTALTPAFRDSRGAPGAGFLLVRVLVNYQSHQWHCQLAYLVPSVKQYAKFSMHQLSEPQGYCNIYVQ